jgi:hypothetical protein
MRNNDCHRATAHMQLIIIVIIIIKVISHSERDTHFFPLQVDGTLEMYYCFEKNNAFMFREVSTY